MSNLEVPGTKYKSAFHEVPMTTPNMEDPAMLRAPGSPVTSAPANQTSGRSPNGSPNGNGRETSMDAPTVVGSETAPGKKSSDTRFNRTNQANNELGLSSTRSRMTQDNTTAKLANPLGDLSEEEVLANATKFAETNNLPVEWMRKGAIVAKHPKAFEHLAILDESDREKLRKEINSPYHQPWVLYQLVTACSLGMSRGPGKTGRLRLELNLTHQPRRSKAWTKVSFPVPNFSTLSNSGSTRPSPVNPWMAGSKVWSTELLTSVAPSWDAG